MKPLLRCAQLQTLNVAVMAVRTSKVKTVEELQDPSSLRLAMGELDANELLVAQAAVRFAHFHLSNLNALIPPAKESMGVS